MVASAAGAGVVVVGGSVMFGAVAGVSDVGAGAEVLLVLLESEVLLSLAATGVSGATGASIGLDSVLDDSFGVVVGVWV